MIRILPDTSTRSITQDPNRLEHLHLFQTVYRFCNDTVLAHRVTETIYTLLQDPRDIKDRQRTIKDFLEFPSSLERLRQLRTEIKTIREENDVLQKHMRTTHKDSADSDLQNTFLQLSASAGMLLRLLRLCKDIHEEFTVCDFRSATLQEVKRYFDKLCSEPTFSKFGTTVQKLSSMYETETSISLEILMNEGKQLSAEWIVLNRETVSPALSSKSFRNRKEPHRTDEVILELTTSSVRTVREQIQQISCALLEILQVLNDDVGFYEFSCRYVTYLQANNIPITFPAIDIDVGVTSVTGMLSLDLIGQKRHIRENDVHFAPITVIYGGNNTGKTTFLRAWALMQLFAQAGLPIPAKSATVGIVSYILTEFASGEKTLGRFEEEVKAIRNIFDSTERDAMILLNEVFQSTSYSEIAEPFWDIVSSMTQKGASVLIVTHNQHFLKCCQGRQNVQMLHANEEFQIQKITSFKEDP